MKKVLVLSALFILASQAFGQQGFQYYHNYTNLFPSAPGALRFGLSGYENPAMLSYVHSPEFTYLWSDKYAGLARTGFFAAFPYFSFGEITNNIDTARVRDYKLSFGFGDRESSMGVSYGWASADRDVFERKDYMTIGSLTRPTRFLSLGIFGSFTMDGKRNEIVVDAGIRPFSTEFLTLFADVSKRDGEGLTDLHWSAGAVAEVIPGLRLTGRYFDFKDQFTVGIQVGLGMLGFTAQTLFDNGGGEPAYNTYAIRVGVDRDPFSTFGKPKQYAQLDMIGGLEYQRYAFFDNKHTLLDLLVKIDAAMRDNSIKGIAINTSGMSAGKEMLWEIREKLREFKSHGKHVIMFLDVADMEMYHFASVADRIVLDPSGRLMLPGYIAGRTFLKGTLEKIGVGFDEWRFFKYKSAVESYSRDSMSVADREQRKKFIDDLYAQTKKEIADGRSKPEAEVDRWINDEVVFMPSDALAKGLVDTLGRWDEVLAIMKNLDGKNVTTTSLSSLSAERRLPDARWGERKRIAVIYALGECAMDAGIKARSLVKTVTAAVEDNAIAAIVFRVDSPGGDGMASDIVAEALKKGKGRKPIIISQGAVAASGGYWLSMYGDTIVAAPGTLTGSIGVIGGWYYNKGLKESLGMRTDFVKAGDHADLGFGFTMPLIGIGLPDRNFTPYERTVMEKSIRGMYSEFVQKVANGRHMTWAQVDSIGQGRIWSGTDGKANKLVDVLGGLDVAINIARVRAGIPADEDVVLVEMPEKGMFNFGDFMPKLFGIDVPKTDPLLNQLLFRLKHNGEPMPMLTVEDYDFGLEK